MCSTENGIIFFGHFDTSVYSLCVFGILFVSLGVFVYLGLVQGCVFALRQN